MDLAVALDRIKSGIADGAADIIAAINDRISALESDTNSWKSRHSRLETQLNELKGITGDKPKEHIEALKNEMEQLKQKIQGLENDKTALQARVTEFEKQALYNSAAQKAGINADAFASLVTSGVISEEIKIESDKVLIGDKAIADYLAQPGKEWIKNALSVIPSTQDNQANPESEDTTFTFGTTSQGQTTPQGGMTPGKADSDPFEALIQSRGYAFPTNSK